MREIYRSPPFSLQGYVAYAVRYEDGSKRTVLQHREVVEQSLGRRLASTEIVHHRNHDKTDNRLDNLEVLSNSDHASHHAQRPIEWADAKCLGCGKEWRIRASVLRGNAKKGRVGPFCSKQCSGRYGANVQVRNACVDANDPSTWPHGTASTYDYRKCRCEVCRAAHAKIAREAKARKKQRVSV